MNKMIDTKRAAGTTEEAARTAIPCNPASATGYSYSASGLSTAYNHGIYNYSTSSNWWLASPASYNGGCAYVNGFGGSVGSYYVDSITYAVRPLVCIPTSTFNAAVTAGTYTLTDA